MRETKFSLDLFFEKDLWSVLRESSKEILIYGMGDGAAKVIHALRSQGLDCRDVFASDDFVRGQSFMGYQVKTFEKCRELYGDFIVLVAFSSSLPEVIGNIERISKLCELYIPDVNIYGDYTSVFDRRKLVSEFQSLNEVYELLSDEASRQFFIQLLRYKLTAKPDDLWKLDDYAVDRSDLIGDVETFCDLGAYVGDTLMEWKRRCPSLNSVIAFEPEPRHYKKLCLLQSSFSQSHFVNAAAMDREGELIFSSGKGRGSSIDRGDAKEGFRPSREKKVSCQTLDRAVSDSGFARVDLIKYDVEGYEYSAILGSRKTIQSHSPNLIVSLYHNHDDLTRLPLLLKSMVSAEAKCFLSRKARCFPAWEVELTIIQ